jgi:hypothetical protein
MARSVSGHRIDAIVLDLAAGVVAHQGVPTEVARYAAAATTDALRDAGMRGLRRRAEAYFGTVVRRRLLRRHAGTVAAARVVVDSVVADLVQSGRSPQDVWDELTRGWGDKLPGEVMEEYRQLLSA